MLFDRHRFAELARRDRELAATLGRLSARIRIGPDDDATDLVIQDGRVGSVAAAEGQVDLIISAADPFWAASLMANPEYTSASLTAGGAELQGELSTLVAPYYSAWERLLILMRTASSGPSDTHPPQIVRRETDDAVGRYAYVRNGEAEARIYYEEAGHGSVPLLLHATAGADSRQWRHMLAYPELRERFRMFAYDLPAHGKSLPVLGARWWEETYQPSKETLMGWAVGLVEQLGLDRPVFMGCSVGGQLALDLAAHRPGHFRAFVALNGWCRPSPAMATFDNAPFRDPAISSEYYTGRVLATTSPLAPDSGRHETKWIYQTNGPGVYAGDNDYFMNAHDLTVDGWRVDTAKTPLFVLAGQLDRTSLSLDNGAPAIPDHVKGAVYRELAALGHFAPSDDPDTFCAAITPVLDELLAACAATETGHV